MITKLTNFHMTISYSCAHGNGAFAGKKFRCGALAACYRTGSNLSNTSKPNEYTKLTQNLSQCS